MLNLDVRVLEDFTMEEQVHLTITATICASIFAVVYYFSSLNQSSIAHEVAMMRKSMGLNGPEASGRHAPVKLGPHSYMTLILSMGCCAVILFLIYLIRVTPFETLVKMTPIHKLIKILINSPDLDEEEERKPPGDQISSRGSFLRTCQELEKRMARLEQCLGPLAHSLEILTQHPDLQPGVQGKDMASGIAKLEAAAVTAEPASASSTTPDLPTSSGLRKRSIVCETPNPI